MARILLTVEVARAAATDAGNEAMRASGRKAWSADDYNAACAEFDRLWPTEAEQAQDAGESIRRAIVGFWAQPRALRRDLRTKRGKMKRLLIIGTLAAAILGANTMQPEDTPQAEKPALQAETEVYQNWFQGLDPAARRKADYRAEPAVNDPNRPLPGEPNVPEPATWASMALGLGICGWNLRRRSK